MTTEPTPNTAPAPTPAAAPGGMFSKPVLVAGLLGGLLGAVFSFALARALPAPMKPPPAAPSEARQYAESVLALLKAGKHDDFVSLLRPAFAEASDEQFAEVRKQMYQSRENDVKTYGGPGGEFEFCRESALGPALSRLVYLEKYPRGCKVWSMIVYHAPDGWKVVSCQTRDPGAATGPPLP